MIQKRYEGLDGLRAFAAIGIVVMHVLSNFHWHFMENEAFRTTIFSFGDLVFLFMVISGFALCCGYYEKVKEGTISLGDFYKKRFAKVWPLFALLCLLEFALSPSVETLYDVFMNCTMVFGFLPIYHTEVIGVGWFLGVVFVFYIVFPFFCTLLEKKWKAWSAFGISLVITFLLEKYYFTPAYMGTTEEIFGRRNFIYCVPFFLAGGLIYLYRDAIAKFVKKFWYIMIAICVATVALYYLAYSSPWLWLACLLMSCAFLCYAIGVEWKGVLDNPVTKFLGEMSMEIYLVHMLAFRVLMMLKLNRLFPNYLLSYIVMCVLTLGLTIGLALAFRYGMALAKRLMQKMFQKEKTTQE